MDLAARPTLYRHRSNKLTDRKRLTVNRRRVSTIDDALLPREISPPYLFLPPLFSCDIFRDTVLRHEKYEGKERGYRDETGGAKRQKGAGTRTKMAQRKREATVKREKIRLLFCSFL